MAENQKPRTEQDDPEQSKRFVDTAKSLDADQTGAWFNQALTTLTKPDDAKKHQHKADKNKAQKP